MNHPRTLAELTPNERNPRKVTPARLAALKKAIDRFGDLGGVVFNVRSGRLVGGHQRRSALDGACPIVRTKTYDTPTRTGTVTEGYVEVDGEAHRYREVDWDKSTEQAANLAANKGAGVFDEAMLAEWFTELQADNFDVDLTMFDSTEIAALRGPGEASTDSVGQGDDIEPRATPTAQIGDVWLLGEHRLMCGDSSDERQLSRLMADRKVDMVYTDPPYGMNLQQCNHEGIGKKRLYGRVIGDDAYFDPSFIFEKFSTVEDVFLWGADYYRRLIPDGGSWIVWDKKADSEGKVINGYDGSHFELCWSRKKHSREICRLIWQGFVGLAADGGKRHHPTQKPVALASWFFARWGKPGDVVIDLYGGSGSTLLACEKADRTCLMMELDPGYCDVIVARWEQMTGKKAEMQK